jgi:hypothetical protein
MNYFRIFIIVTFIAGAFLNDISFVDLLFEAVAVIMMLLITRYYPIKQHIAKYAVLLTYWISMIMMPSYHLVINQIGDFVINRSGYGLILGFGSSVLLTTVVSWLIFSSTGFKKNIGKSQIQYIPRPVSTNVLNIIFVVMYGLSFFSYAIGLSRMGYDQVELPFHLSGIITLLRTTFFPIFFAIIVENYILRNKKLSKKYYVLFLIWSLLEVFVRLSKGALASSLMMVLLLLFVYYRPNMKTIIRIIAPFAVIILFLYPIVETMRSVTDKGIWESFNESRMQVNQDEKRAVLLVPLNRTFMMPQMYAKDYNYLNKESFFDFSLAPAVIAWKGAARYQTFVIDGYSTGINHSSGTTGLQDPLLHGGYGLCYVVIILLMLMATIIDHQIRKQQYSIYIQLVLILWGLCNSQNISSLYDSVGLQTLLMQIASITIAYHFNFAKKRKISLPMVEK